ncbi:gp436 family protein [Pelotomaculum propionicicum]|uniref:DUF1320 domain-containing protein n=1 Tax=Pelotomaculum propionicicum TaxID=258475 RepID=A0A4Y7RJZ6_9FIRM|nr:DUF1320 domain-containing protein [Pelotomaculum propionicicum]TEB09146.1 hypothetical protein Pmgp_03367 [Pelotomaculum propionicicum]
MYCTLADLEKRLDRQKLIEISNDRDNPVLDDQGNPTVNEANVNMAIEEAGAEMDTYLGRRYPVPLSPVPDVVVKLAVDIAIYNLFSRGWMQQEDQTIYTRYRGAIKLLEKMASGKVQLPGREQGIVVRAPAKVFGDDFRKAYD